MDIVAITSPSSPPPKKKVAQSFISALYSCIFTFVSGYDTGDGVTINIILLLFFFFTE